MLWPLISLGGFLVVTAAVIILARTSTVRTESHPSHSPATVPVTVRDRPARLRPAAAPGRADPAIAPVVEQITRPLPRAAPAPPLRARHTRDDPSRLGGYPALPGGRCRQSGSSRGR